MPKVRGAKRVSKYSFKKGTSMPTAYENVVKEADVSVFNDLAALEEKVGQILTSHDVSGNFRVMYHNFARAVWSQNRKGTLTAGKINALKAYFEAQGADGAILDEIMNAVVPTG